MRYKRLTKRIMANVYDVELVENFDKLGGENND